MIISSVFLSILSLYLLYRVILLITGNRWASIFGMYLLALTYSYLGQATVLKFYPLNLLIVASLVYIGTLIALRGFKSEYAYTVAFILGLSSGAHHSALLMLVPMFLLFISFGLKSLFPMLKSSLFFLLGFSVNLYSLIRSYKESAFLFMPTRSLEAFIYMFLREGYRDSSSVSAIGSGIDFLEGYAFAIKNLFFILEKNFTLAGLILFVVGIFSLFKLGFRIAMFILSSFFMLGVFLSKISLGFENPDLRHLYVTAHQYFLPAFFIFTLVCSIPIAYLYSLLDRDNLRLANRLIPILAIMFPLIFIFERLLDQNFGRNYVPYSFGKTSLGTMPPYSLYMTLGDNAVFQTWYLNTLLGYRRDICSVEIPPEEDSIYLRGCQPRNIYRRTHEPFFGGNLKVLSEEIRLFSSSFLKEDSFLAQVFKPKYILLYYALLPKDDYERYILPLEDRFIYNQKYMYTVYEDCLNHRSDDYYTLNLCKIASYNFAMAAKILEKRGAFTLSKPNDRIDRLMNMYFNIAQHNSLKKSFYYAGENGKND
jgi:hypothetical protein